MLSLISSGWEDEATHCSLRLGQHWSENLNQGNRENRQIELIPHLLLGHSSCGTLCTQNGYMKYWTTFTFYSPPLLSWTKICQMTTETLSFWGYLPLKWSSPHCVSWSLWFYFFWHLTSWYCMCLLIWRFKLLGASISDNQACIIWI